MVQNMLLLKDKNVLYAEDDNITRRETSDILGMLFDKVYVASDGEEAYRLYEDERPDLVITDIKMPKKDGLGLVRQIRKESYAIPIILMTSFVEQEMLLNAANLSIDGYLVKPVELEKLTFTICKAIQRANKELGLIALGKQLYYNSATQELYRNGSVVALGGKEHELLQLLIKNRHRTVTKEEIGAGLWPLDPICESAIKNIVLRLRKKLGIEIIISVRGVGYRLDIRNLSRPGI
ncbi:MAG: response regulator transcription factor [Sulfuricurvum sp.]|jgi:DNA-binding response OmpR family regulator|uniref:response regulator transcription factor n=1 Tax=Sulfuricurvum sp. TaxID=2025608 RepID=UPI0025D269ED|nr:response regulator transcription factor [Sulfuricurvum sp.]MCK9372492.1 response regulator transcription factor [Sulfuricurvum sp.]